MKDAPQPCLAQEHRWLLEDPIAHRGLHHNPEIPENSLAGFQAAVDRRCPIELDVRLLADGGIAVVHDAQLFRLTGRRASLGRQDRASLQEFRLLGTNQRIPLLRDALEAIGGAVPLLIELKNETASVGPLELGVLHELSGYRGNVALQSFNPLTVRLLKQRGPKHACGMLLTRVGPLPVPVRWLSRWTGMDFIAYNVDSRMPASFTRKSAECRKPLILWTIRNQSQLEMAQRIGVNYIFEEF